MVEKAKLVCTYCHKANHLEANCFKEKAMGQQKEDKLTSSPPDSEKTSILLIASCNYCNEFRTSDSVVKMNHNTFIGDSGATCHMRYSKTGMFDLVDFRAEVTVGNNDFFFIVAKGKYMGMSRKRQVTTFKSFLLMFSMSPICG
jgi:hypothetical protein